MMAMFFFIAHEKGFKFHARPQTGAYSCFHLKASAKMVIINSYPYKMMSSLHMKHCDVRTVECEILRRLLHLNIHYTEI